MNNVSQPQLRSFHLNEGAGGSAVKQSVPGGAYVTTSAPRPRQAGSYVSTSQPRAGGAGSYVTTTAQPSGPAGSYVGSVQHA